MDRTNLAYARLPVHSIASFPQTWATACDLLTLY